jgi:hypothetical protein
VSPTSPKSPRPPASSILLRVGALRDERSSDLAMMLWRLSKTGYALPETLRAFAEAEWQRESVREFVAMERPRFVAYS